MGEHVNSVVHLFHTVTVDLSYVSDCYLHHNLFITLLLGSIA